MKTILTFLFISAFALNIQAQGKVKEDSITVKGNCMACKKRIEAALEIKGVKYADWNMKTKKLFIAYRPDKISTEEVHKTIADVGHDTDIIKAKDVTYADLPFCCLYRDHNPHGPNGEEQLKDVKKNE